MGKVGGAGGRLRKRERKGKREEKEGEKRVERI